MAKTNPFGALLVLLPVIGLVTRYVRVASVIIVATLLLATLASVRPSGASDDDDESTFQITITNLTPGQPLTPPVLATHAGSISIFTLGEEASLEIQEIAENGNNGPLVSTLSGDDRVHDVVVGLATDVPGTFPGLVPANDPGLTGLAHSATFTITADARARFLSMAAMLICTNDGFTGLDSVRLPRNKRKSLTVLTVAYDARTEINTEDFADMVPPCQFLITPPLGEPGTGETDPTLAESGIIIPHPGIIGGDDLLPAVHGWSDPVTKVVIERIDDDDDSDERPRLERHGQSHGVGRVVPRWRRHL